MCTLALALSSNTCSCTMLSTRLSVGAVGTCASSLAVHTTPTFVAAASVCVDPIAASSVI
jgi:hypothetical protein